MNKIAIPHYLLGAICLFYGAATYVRGEGEAIWIPIGILFGWIGDMERRKQGKQPL